eukprot:6016029-Prymnesium_polylepis.1
MSQVKIAPNGALPLMNSGLVSVIDSLASPPQPASRSILVVGVSRSGTSTHHRPPSGERRCRALR